jgi:hypothetical protein
MGADPSYFHERCRFCGDVIGELPPGGLTSCAPCGLAATVAGPCPAGTSADDYLRTVLALANVVRQLPQGHAEAWAGYKLRASLAFAEWQNMRPIPARLRMPLPASAVAAAERGGSLQAILVAATPPPVEKNPVRKKKAEPVRSKSDGVPAKTKIW